VRKSFHGLLESTDVILRLAAYDEIGFRMEPTTKFFAETRVITGKEYAMHDSPLADELGGVAWWDRA
jgi:hypothetical protein